MDVHQKLLYFLLDLILPLLVGYFLIRKRLVASQTFDRMMLLGIMVFSPLLTGLSFWKAPLSSALLWIPILGALMQVVPGLIGHQLSRHRYSSPIEQGSFVLAVMFSNRSVIGILSVYILFGQEGYAYSRLALLLGAPTFYIVGFALAKYYYEKDKSGNTGRPPLKKVLFSRNQLPVIGILIGLILNLADVPRPAHLIDQFIFPRLVDLTAWLLILPIGATFDLKKIKNYVGDGLIVSVIRFVLTPLMIWPLAILSGCDGVILGTMIVLAFTPASVGAVIAAKLNGLNEHLPMAVYIVTSLLYLIFIFPLLVLACRIGII